MDTQVKTAEELLSLVMMIEDWIEEVPAGSPLAKKLWKRWREAYKEMIEHPGDS
jgi:hypothetical protein